MPVNIHISGDNAAEALKELATLAGPLVGGQAVAALAPVTVLDTTKKLASRKTKAEDAAPVVDAPVTPPAADEAEEDAPGDDDAPIPTVVDLRAKAGEIGTTTEGKKSVKALLDEFGSKNITELPEDKRAAFLARLEELA